MFRSKIFYLSMIACVLFMPESMKAQESKKFRTNGQVFKSKSKPRPPHDDISMCPSSEFRTIDGECNNLRHNGEYWGSSDISLLRSMLAEYGSDDHFNSMAGEDRPSPRAISNLLCSEETEIPSERGLSSFVFSWGQFLDHDISLTPEDHIEYEPITLPIDEPLFTSDIPFFRSAIYTGTGVNNYRQQRNLITSWIDGSNIYGSDDERAAWLRSFTDGKLKMSQGGLLPYNTINGEYTDTIDPEAPSMAGDGDGLNRVFVAGDVRASEQPGLTALHTLFVREHNRICDRLLAEGETNDEEMYQKARKEVGAIIQNISYYEFLPALGIKLNKHRSYDDRVQADIANLFATAAYRLGHTMVTEQILLLDENCQEYSDALSLIDVFFNPSIIREEGIDLILKGLAVQTQNSVDLKITDNLRNFLFGDPSSGQSFGLDLASLNIQRGRDHGLPNYNSVRKKYTGIEAKRFEDITKNKNIQNKLKELYGSVNKIDLWIGLLAEDKLKGRSVGKTLHEILKKQFENLRDGDRFYFEHDKYLSKHDKNRIRSIRLSDVIKNNTDIDFIQMNVFFADDCFSNKRINTAVITRALNTLELYPNPSSDLINVSLELEEGNGLQTSIVNKEGRLIRSLLLTTGINRIDITDLVPGVYYLSFIDSGVIEPVRFIKIE